MEVRYTKWGLGGWYGDHIELNEELKGIRWIKLHNYMLQHELGHSNKFDLGHDAKIKGQTFAMLGFLLTHPRTWTSLIPIEKKDDTIYIEWNSLILLGFLGVLAFVLFKYIIF